MGYIQICSQLKELGIWFNQQPGDGIEILENIDFFNFSRDARVEFHGCRTAEIIEVKGIQVTNFTKLFSIRLAEAG